MASSKKLKKITIQNWYSKFNRKKIRKYGDFGLKLDKV
jgi:hypothetical protein